MKKTAILTSIALIAALGSTATLATAKGKHGGPGFDLTEMDANGDGSITVDEVTAFQTARFNETDADGNGQISEEELVAAITARFDGDIPERAEKRISRMFERMDADESGGISVDEQVSEERTTRMFERLDQDEDGTISAAELEEAKDRRGGKGKGKGKGKRGDRDASSDG